MSSLAEGRSPLTFSLMTYNVWKTNGIPTFWSTRRNVLRRQLEKLDPDVLMVQELCPKIQECILEALPGHKFIGSEKAVGLKGFTHEGNIFYRGSLFQEVDSGCDDIEQEEEYRRLFWIRLRPLVGNGRNILFSTAHFTWQGCKKEIETNLNVRKIQAKNTVKVLNKLQQESEYCFFGGDLNESFWPKRILEGASFSDCFSQLGLPCRPTHPNRPTLSHEDQNADSVLDWLFARPAADASVRPLAATVVRDCVGLSSDDPLERKVLSVAASDHCPVLAVYKVKDL